LFALRTARPSRSRSPSLRRSPIATFSTDSTHLRKAVAENARKRRSPFLLQKAPATNFKPEINQGQQAPPAKDSTNFKPGN
jgi:hypothetical protein